MAKSSIFELLAGHRRPDPPDPLLVRLVHAAEGIRHELQNLTGQVSRVAVLLSRATGFVITQRGAIMGVINGIQVGATGNFTATPNGALQSGNVPTWAADDTLVTISVNPDGLGASISVSASDTSNTFNLTVSGINSAGSPFSTTVAVPILPAAPTPATAFDINQTS